MSYTKEILPHWFKTESGNEYEIKPLSSFEYLRVLPHIQNGAMTGEGIELTVGLSVINWKNEGEPFTKKVLADLYLADTIELAQEIIKITEASEEKIKN